LLTVEVGGGGGGAAEGDDEEAKGEAEGEGATAEPTPTDAGGTTKPGGLGGLSLGKGKDVVEAVVETVDDRVFVCLGKSLDGLDTRHVWVMTINRTWDTITFWEAKNHSSYIVRGRIMKDQTKYLESYLSPNLSAEEKAAMEAFRLEQKALY
jgi:hypothetical protein